MLEYGNGVGQVAGRSGGGGTGGQSMDVGAQLSQIVTDSAHTISTLRVPDFLTVDGLYRGLKQRGFVIYGCKGQLAARHVQVANMGEIPDTTLDAFLAAVTEVVAAARSAQNASGREDARVRVCSENRLGSRIDP